MEMTSGFSLRRCAFAAIMDVPDDDPLGRQQRGAEYLQRFVFGSLGRDFAPQSVATFDFENCHMCCRVLSV